MHPKVYAALAVVINEFAGFNLKDVEFFTAGVIQGLIQKDDLSKIESCLHDAQDLSTIMTKAFAEIAQGDITHIAEGIADLGQFLVALPNDLDDCEGMKDDVTRIETWANQFKTPSKVIPKIAKNVMLHFGKITTDANNLETDIGTDDMLDAGMQVADLMVTVVGKVGEEPETLPYTQW